MPFYHYCTCLSLKTLFKQYLTLLREDAASQMQRHQANAALLAQNNKEHMWLVLSLLCVFVYLFIERDVTKK